MKKFLTGNTNELSSFEIVNGYLQLIYHNGILDNYNKCKELSENLSIILEKENYYSFEMVYLNIIFYFFGYKDKNVFNDIIKKYEIFFMKYFPLNKEELETLTKLTLNINNITLC